MVVYVNVRLLKESWLFMNTLHMTRGQRERMRCVCVAPARKGAVAVLFPGSTCFHWAQIPFSYKTCPWADKAKSSVQGQRRKVKARERGKEFGFFSSIARTCSSIDPKNKFISK